MPSLRQPVGPLPASIYWRRRVVVIVAAVAVAALVIWLMTDQGGGGDGAKDKAAQAVPTQSQNQTPAQAITPGASPSGPANNSRPGSGSGGGSASGGAVGGSGGGDVSLSTGGTTGGGAAPAPATGGAAGGGAAGGAGGTGGSGATGAGGSGGGTPAGTGGAGGNGGQPPVNTTEIMALPVCASSQVTLNLASAQNSYQPKDKPKLALTINNSSATNCRVDLGRTASAITVTASNGERIWSSGDCPADRNSSWVQLPANGGLTETFGWDRVRSKPQCATADPAPAPAGNYLVVADLTGLSGGQASARSPIRLEN
ncbi:hypothetical protein SAMN05216371_4497 [Streptomyces sp. TLI_053]|uniref:hypothetical protein n=1 Tax=Streptomyces sp. TLI_053 TaxID=1855352 RepID=UPI00087D9381|nr:hypothetical protein [Streptomyces sp. TLI_053]SDT73483.1 hypothetical protein SAMN05216371_4497 [Streptomyces sp. TLI_053]